MSTVPLRFYFIIAGRPVTAPSIPIAIGNDRGRVRDEDALEAQLSKLSKLLDSMPRP